MPSSRRLSGETWKRNPWKRNPYLCALRSFLPPHLRKRPPRGRGHTPHTPTPGAQAPPHPAAGPEEGPRRASETLHRPLRHMCTKHDKAGGEVAWALFGLEPDYVSVGAQHVVGQNRGRREPLAAEAAPERKIAARLARRTRGVLVKRPGFGIHFSFDALRLSCWLHGCPPFRLFSLPSGISIVNTNPCRCALGYRSYTSLRCPTLKTWMTSLSSSTRASTR